MDEKKIMSKLFWLPQDKQQVAIDFINFLYEKEIKEKKKPLEKRLVGAFEGQIKILPGFDGPIEGMEEYYQ